jgi:hypothetical protein
VDDLHPKYNVFAEKDRRIYELHFIYGNCDFTVSTRLNSLFNDGSHRGYSRSRADTDDWYFDFRWQLNKSFLYFNLQSII